VIGEGLQNTINKNPYDLIVKVFFFLIWFILTVNLVTLNEHWIKNKPTSWVYFTLKDKLPVIYFLRLYNSGTG
jgi:hypothetical protein